MNSISVAATSPANPITDINVYEEWNTLRQRERWATLCNNRDFVSTYGSSIVIRTVNGCSERSAPTESIARSIVCRVINSWALAVNASASASKVLDSALASNAVDPVEDRIVGSRRQVDERLRGSRRTRRWNQHRQRTEHGQGHEEPQGGIDFVGPLHVLALGPRAEPTVRFSHRREIESVEVGDPTRVERRGVANGMVGRDR